MPSSLQPHVSQAWEIEHAAHGQRLRSAFAAAQPSSGVLTRDVFAALVRSLEGAAAAAADPAIDDERVGVMYEAALDCSSGMPAGSKYPRSQLRGAAHAATHRPRSPTHLPRAVPLGPRGEPSPLPTNACSGRALVPPLPKVADGTASDPPGLLKQPESDVLLLEAFVYVCRSAGL